MLARRRELLLQDCEYLETWPPSVWTGFTLLITIRVQRFEFTVYDKMELPRPVISVK
jgi:hypothetical protein